MKYVLCIGLLMICISVSLVQAQNIRFISVKVEKVIDGDTLTASFFGYRFKVRLYGIDAPEKRQAGGKEATKRLAELLVPLKDGVKLEILDFDRYGRIIAIPYISEAKSVQEALLDNGQAWLYSRYCKEDICKEWRALESMAKATKKGLWEDDKAISPWKWRQQDRRREKAFSP